MCHGKKKKKKFFLSKSQTAPGLGEKETAPPPSHRQMEENETFCSLAGYPLPLTTVRLCAR